MGLINTPLRKFLTEYKEYNVNSQYRPVAVGKYGIRTRESIYKKELAQDYSKNKVIFKNTLTVGMGSNQIDIGILSDDVRYSVSPAYHTFLVEGVNSDYLRYCLESRNQDMTKRFLIPSARQGKTIDFARWLGYEVPVCDEQQQLDIVGELDKINIAINQLKQTFLLYDEMIKSKFIEMFGDPVVNTKNYPTQELSSLGYFNRGRSQHRPRNDKILLGGPYPLIQTGDVANADTYINTFEQTYSELGLKQSKMWNRGTLCITIAANIAKTAILNIDACFPDSIIGFIPNQDVRVLFVHNWFKFFQPILEEQAPSVAQKNLNGTTLGKVRVIVPPIESQMEFENFVKQIEKLKLCIQKEIDLYNELLEKKMNEYFG